MLNHGVPLEAVGRVLGHGDLKTTAVYARVLDSSSDRAVDVLAQVLDR
jgi:site-specific recombinase XerD